MSSGPAEWREDDHRNVAIGPPRVLGEVREALGPPSELPLALLAGCLPCQDVDRLAPHLDSGVRLCLEVVVPGGVARRSAVRGEDHAPRLVGQVSDRVYSARTRPRAGV